MDDDMTRAEFSRRVFQLLSNQDFRSRLEVVTEAGEYPIVTAMMDDKVEGILHAVAAAGWRANVALPFVDGFTVLSMDMHESASLSELMGTQHLDVAMTMRGFLAMVIANDSGHAYRFKVDGVLGAPSNSGEARLAQVGT